MFGAANDLYGSRPKTSHTVYVDDDDDGYLQPEPDFEVGQEQPQQEQPPERPAQQPRQQRPAQSDRQQGRNGARFSRSIGTFRSPDRTELAKLALDYISFSISSGHKGSAQVPTEDEMQNIQGAKSRADAARRGKLDDIIKELFKEDM